MNPQSYTCLTMDIHIGDDCGQWQSTVKGADIIVNDIDGSDWRLSNSSLSTSDYKHRKPRKTQALGTTRIIDPRT
jgi:hypothetical protein